MLAPIGAENNLLLYALPRHDPKQRSLHKISMLALKLTVSREQVQRNESGKQHKIPVLLAMPVSPAITVKGHRQLSVSSLRDQARYLMGPFASAEAVAPATRQEKYYSRSRLPRLVGRAPLWERLAASPGARRFRYCLTYCPMLGSQTRTCPSSSITYFLIGSLFQTSVRTPVCSSPLKTGSSNTLVPSGMSSGRVCSP